MRVLWDRSPIQHPTVLQEARKLPGSPQQGSYHAEVNALELQGEAHLLPEPGQQAITTNRPWRGPTQGGPGGAGPHPPPSAASIPEFGERDATSEFRQALTIWESLQDTVQLCGLEVRPVEPWTASTWTTLSMQHFVHALRHCDWWGQPVLCPCLERHRRAAQEAAQLPEGLAVMDSARDLRTAGVRPSGRAVC